MSLITIRCHQIPDKEGTAEQPYEIYLSSETYWHYHGRTLSIFHCHRRWLALLTVAWLREIKPEQLLLRVNTVLEVSTIEAGLQPAHHLSIF